VLWLASDMEMRGMDMTGFRMIPAGIGRDTGDGSRRSPFSRNSHYDAAKGSGQYYAPVNFTKYPDTETAATEEK
jgi:hypothetical protein